MTQKTQPHMADGSIETFESGPGYELRECGKGFAYERLAEHALRISGALVILAGYAQWFVPETFLRGDPIIARTFLTILFMGTGLAIYLFGSRGFRQMVRLDLKSRELVIARLNSKNRTLIARRLPLRDIESLVIKRPRMHCLQAVLELRLKGVARPRPLLGGNLQDLELIHLRLCRDIRAALDAAPKRIPRHPVRQARATTPRPKAKLSAV